MAVSQRNQARYRAVLISREVKWLFVHVPSRIRGWLIGLAWRWLFKVDGEKMHRAGEVILADLRDFARVGMPIFDTDPLVMARRLGRREVVERIMNYLELDETVVQQLMQVDDGLGD